MWIPGWVIFFEIFFGKKFFRKKRFGKKVTRPGTHPTLVENNPLVGGGRFFLKSVVCISYGVPTSWREEEEK